MFETTSESTEKDNTIDTPAVNFEPFSLPIIPRKPMSRGSNHSKKELSRKQKLNLPNLPSQYFSQIDTQTINGDKDKQNFQLKSKTAFAKQVKQRLNIVLGEMPYIANNMGDDDQDSDDMDFEQKIHQNRQLIKMNKIKRENDKNNLILQQNKNPKIPKNKKSSKSRNQSLFEKKIKQYRDISIQNKHLKLRRQNIKQHQNFVSDPHIAQDNIKQVKQRYKNQNISLKQQKSTEKKPSSRGIVRLLSQRSSQKNLNQNIKNDNLFDNIQNYLSNPHGRQKQDKQLVGLALIKAKRDIQDKIKVIDEKLGLGPNQNMIDQKQQLLKMSESIRDWRRIQLGQNKLSYQKSNFDEEIDRIGNMQQKNSLCLQKYVQCQKILLELELRKKQQAKLNIKSH